MNMEEKDEKIMDEIRKKTTDIQVPDSLLPENMMKKIKESGVKQSKKAKQSNKGIRWNFIFAFAGVAAVFCIVMSVLLFNNNSFDKDSTSDNRKDSNSLEENKQEYNPVISNVEGIVNVSRQEAIDIIKSQALNEYVNNNRYNWSGSKNESIIYDAESSLDGNFENSGAPQKGYDDKEAANESVNESSDDHYENNDQVNGVVEGDIVRTDGKYIYSMNKSGIINIVKADSGKMEKVSEINAYQTVEEDFAGKDNYNIYDSKMYINGNKLLIVLNVNVYDYGDEDIDNMYYKDVNRYYEVDYMPYKAKNSIYILQYDISDVQSPEKDGKATVEGNEVSSRMVGNYLYIIAEKRNFINTGYGNMWKSFANIEEEAIPKINGKEVSDDRMYVCGENENVEAIQIICAMDINDSLKVTDTCSTLVGGSEVYVSNNNIYVMSAEYGNEGVKTIISKYNYADGKVTVYAQGTVNGSVEDQFSADESQGYLRVVTTMNVSGDNDTNSVYILDEKLNITGELNGIAENEYIKSVRFIDNRAYFVTFRQTDPLFVVDLSDNTNPVILDELKVTGFSSYLHVWSDDLLLGIGSEATDEGRITGAKISMFSRTDDKLSEVSRYIIDSGYLYDMNISYKNIFVDAGKNLIGLGVMEEKLIADKYNNVDFETMYNFYLYKYENGEIKNILKYNNENIEYKDDYIYNMMYRGLYVGDYLYIITLDEGIQSINLNDMSYIQYISFK